MQANGSGLTTPPSRTAKTKHPTTEPEARESTSCRWQRSGKDLTGAKGTLAQAGLRRRPLHTRLLRKGSS